MRQLYRLLEERPGLANMVITFVRGKGVTLKELIHLVEKGDPDAIRAANQLGLDPEGDEWLLAEEYFKRIKDKDIRIYMLGKELTPEDILEHIKKRDEIGKKIVEMYKKTIKKVLG